MSASTFGTHAAVTALRDAGLDEAPAVAIVNTVREATTADQSELATKVDLATPVASTPYPPSGETLFILRTRSDLPLVFASSLRPARPADTARRRHR